VTIPLGDRDYDKRWWNFSKVQTYLGITVKSMRPGFAPRWNLKSDKLLEQCGA